MSYHLTQCDVVICEDKPAQTVNVAVLNGSLSVFQFTEEYLQRIPHKEWPRVIVVADGSCGDSCSVLGISSDYIVESCHAYGANASIERLDQRQVRKHTQYLHELCTKRKRNVW